MTRPVGGRRLVVPTGVAMIAVAFGLARYGFGLLLPDMRAALDIDSATAGLVGSSAYASYLVANAGVVPLTGRVGARLPLALATLAAAGGMSTIALAHDVSGLLAGVLLAGASAGLAFPPYADIVAVVVSPARRATAWAAISSGTGWGVALAGPLVVLAGVGWRTAWLVFAGVALVVGAVAVPSAPRGRLRPGAEPVTLRLRWFCCRRSGPLLLSAVLVGAGSSVWWAFSVDAMRAFGVAAGPARLVYAGCGVAGVLATLTGPLVARAGLRRVHLATVGVVGASLALLATAGAGDGPGDTGATAAVAGVAAALFGVAYNGVIAVQGLWSSEVFADRPSAGLAAVSTGLTLGTLAGPAAAGLVVALAGYPTALVVAGLVLLAAALLPPPRGRPDVEPRPGRPEPVPA